MQCQQNRRLVTLKISNLKSSRNLWWVVEFNNCCLNCDWPCNYPFSFSGRLALLSRKKGIKRGICSEVLRGVSLKVMKVMLTCFFFIFSHCWVHCQAGSHPHKGKKSKLAIFLLGWELEKLWFLLYHSQWGRCGWMWRRAKQQADMCIIIAK